MSKDDRTARSSPGLDAPEPEEVKPTGLPEAVSTARARTPVPEESKPEPQRPPGLTQMTPSARLRLQLVLDDEEKRVSIQAPAEPKPAEPKKPGSDKREAKKKPSSTHMPFVQNELKDMRSLGRWVAFSGLMFLTVGALTGLSYATGEGSVAHVVVGILASALGLWLLAAAVAFYRVSRETRGSRARHHLVTGFSLLRSAFLLKAILLFSAMALGCFVFSLAVSVLFLL